MPYKDKHRQMEFIAESSVLIGVRFIKSTDADLLAWLDKQPQKSTAIKDVLREYIKEEGR